MRTREGMGAERDRDTQRDRKRERVFTATN